MRECIYCGRQLEAGEQCSCAMSVAKRKEREAATSQDAQQAQNAQQPEPNTKDKKTQKEEKERAKAEAKQAKKDAKEQKSQARKAKFQGYGREFKPASKNVLKNVWSLFIRFLKSPIDTIMNPGRMGVAETLVLVIFEGIIGGLCTFAIISGASRGLIGNLGNIIGFGGIQGYNIILSWIMSAVSGAFSGLFIFFAYSGIFYAVNRWVFKQFNPYWDFVKHFAFIALPMALIGIVGTVLGFFALRTFLMLLICGGVAAVVLTYEILRSLWYHKSSAKTMYYMLFCTFVFLMVITYITKFTK